MAASVRGTFSLLDKASSTLDKMERRAIKLDAALNSVGNRLDELDRKLDSTVVHVRAVNTALDELGRKRVTPKINLEGVTKAIVQIDALKRAKTSLDHHFTENAKSTGPVAKLERRFSGLTRTLGTAGAAAKGVLTAFPRIMALALALSPIIVSLAGGVTALAASLASAAGGAGVLGAGGLTMFAAGIGSTIAVAKSALSPLKNYQKAVVGLTKAQQAGDPAKIRVAADAVNQLSKQSPGLARFAVQLQKTKDAFKNTVGDQSRQSFFNFGAKGLSAVRTALRNQRGDIRDNADATFKAMDPLISLIRSQQFQRFFDDLSRTYQRSIGPIISGLTDYIRGIMTIIDHGLPYITKMAQGFERAGSAFRGRAAMDGKSWVDHMVKSFRTWMGLIKSAGHLLSALFSGGGRAAGDSLVGSLTNTFNSWSQWLRDNPNKLQQFFKNTVNDVRSLGETLTSVVDTLFKMSQALRPITNLVLSLANSLGGPGMEALVAAYAGGRGIYKGIGRYKRGGTAQGPGGTIVPLGGGAGGSGGAGSILGPFGANYRTMRNSGMSRLEALRFARGVPGGGLTAAGVAGGLGKAALRKAGPLAAVFALSDFLTTQGNIGDKTKGAINGLGFGLPGLIAPGFFKSAAEKRQEAAQALANAQDQGVTRGNREVGGGLGSMGSMMHRARAIRNQLAGAGQPATNAAPYTYTDPVTHETKTIKPEVAPVLTKPARARLRAELEQLAKGIKMDVHVRRQIDREHGGLLSRQFSRGYNALLTAGPGGRAAMTSEAALKAVNARVIKRMEQLSPAGAAALGKTYDSWARAMAKKQPELHDQVAKIHNDLVDTLHKTSQNAGEVGGKIVTDLSGKWKNLRQRLNTENQKILSDFTSGTTKVEAAALRTLSAMGYSAVEAKALISNGPLTAGQTADPAPFKAGSKVPGLRRASGGRVPGVGLQDTVTMNGALVAPGEVLVANRHTERRVDQMLAPYGTSLDHEVTHEGRPHSEPMKRYAGGGRHRGGGAGAANFDGHPSNVAPGIAKLIATMQSRFPLQVTSTTDHSLMTTSGNVSDHSTGHAVDLSASPEIMNRASGWIKNSGLFHQLKQGIHNPSLSVNAGQIVPESYWGSAVWAQHASHLHLALAGALSGAFGGAGAKMLPRHLLKHRNGLMGRVAQRSIDAYVSALNGRLQSAGGGAGPMDSPGGSPIRGYSGPLDRVFPRTFSGEGGVQLTPEQVAGLASRAGLPGDAFSRIAHGESNYFPGIQQRDPGDGNVGYGLWQMTPHAWGSDSPAYKHMQALGGIPAMFNPWKNALMAKYLYDAAGHSTKPWYGTKYLDHGGRVPFGGWYGEGGSFTADRPTYIGVGERGKETVTIKPHRAGSQGGEKAIHIEHLVIHGGDDVKNEVLKAFRQLTREIRIQEAD